MKPAFLLTRIKHHDFVITPQWDETVGLAKFNDEIQHRSRIWPAINVVPERDNCVVRAWRNVVK